MTPEELKDRTCSFEDCRHLNSENICCIHNQENCILYRTKKELEKLKELAEELKCCANCKHEEQGYMVEPCKSCNRYFPTLKVGTRDKWERR